MRAVPLGVTFLLVFTSLAFAGTFANGGFEDGTFGGWTTGGGCFGPYGDVPGTCAPYNSGPLDPTDFLPGGAYYNANRPWKSAIVTPGSDPIVGAALNMVFSGDYAARVNDSTWNSHVSVISQSVTNYTGTDVYFAWAAVLQSAHSRTESSEFAVKLTDDTDHVTLYSQEFEQCTGCVNTGFIPVAGGWYYHPWTVLQLPVITGHDFTLTMLAADCDQGGHGGYAYLDGFGAAPPQPGIPEPGTILLSVFGLAGLALYRRKK